MKKIVKIFSSIILIGVLYASWGTILTHKNQTRDLVQKAKIITEKKLNINQPCAKPKTFSIGTIDPRFNISREKLVKLAQQAADIWNKATGRKLLEYDSSSPFKINMVFDQRQSQTLEKNKLEENLKELEATNKKMAQKYSVAYNVYKQKLTHYKKAVKDYEKQLDKYNQEVNYWNNQGGAPKDVYDDLQKEKRKLKDLSEKLEKQQKEINNLAKETNNLANQENKIANQYNTNLVTYKSEFGIARRFEKGVFDTREINIYQFQKDSDLRLVLAHEMGHYLGMQHVQNSKSIMYYLLGDQDLNNPVPSQQDMEELKKVCRL